VNGKRYEKAISGSAQDAMGDRNWEVIHDRKNTGLYHTNGWQKKYVEFAGRDQSHPTPFE
jgi:hypothetical protein